MKLRVYLLICTTLLSFTEASCNDENKDAEIISSDASNRHPDGSNTLSDASNMTVDASDTRRGASNAASDAPDTLSDVSNTAPDAMHTVPDVSDLRPDASNTDSSGVNDDCPPLDEGGIDRDDGVIWVASSTNKIKPGDVPPTDRSSRIVLSAARNEYESAQVVVHGLSNLSNVDMTVSDLCGPGGALIPASAGHLYRTHYIECEKECPENWRDRCHTTTFHSGWLPDPMVPFIDPLSGQRIGGKYGAPFNVESGKNGLVWLELHVPRDAAPGEYTGTIDVSFDGYDVGSVPIVLTVWPVTLADTTELLTYFCLSRDQLAEGDNPQPYNSYLHSLHNHRMDVWYVPGLSHGLDDSGRVTWSPRTDETLDAYFDGSLFEDGIPGKTYLFGYGLGGGFQQTMANNASARVEILKQFEEHYGDKPWIGKVAWFFIDEPTPDSMDRCRTVGEQIQQYSPSIGYLLTTGYTEELSGLVTIWDPIINTEVIDYDAPDPQLYRDQIARGHRAINCITVVSNVPTSPSIFIHHPGMNTRIWTWVSWTLGHQGIELWNTVPAPSLTEPALYWDAWGDGSLFYPSSTADLGIPNDIPLPSIRLKILRDGIEDYELLAMLKRINPEEANRIGRMMCQETHAYDGSFTDPIQHVSWNWNDDGQGDRQVPGYVIWESSHERLTTARAAIFNALAN